MFGLTFLHLLICFAARSATNVCVSSLRFGSGLYDEAGFLGVHMWGCVDWDLDVVPCWWSLYLAIPVGDAI